VVSSSPNVGTISRTSSRTWDRDLPGKRWIVSRIPTGITNRETAVGQRAKSKRPTGEGETPIPSYITNPLDGIPPLLLPGIPGYSLGSFNADTPDTKMLVTSVAINGSNVATLGVQITEGNIPAVGSLISVRGTKTTTSGGAPNFNVSNIALTAVSIDPLTGVGTVSFALTSTTIATTPDAGEAVVKVPVVLETLPGSATPGLQFSVQSGSGAQDGQRGITWFTKFSGSPATVTIDLQGADVDEDAAYTTIDASTNTAGESRSLGNVNYQFYRILAASTGGTSPKIAAGIMVR